jgi:hypothetical protein
MKNIGLLPSAPLIHFSLNIGAAVEVFLLSLALGDRINFIKAERLAAQQQTLKSVSLR